MCTETPNSNDYSAKIVQLYPAKFNINAHKKKEEKPPAKQGENDEKNIPLIFKYERENKHREWVIERKSERISVQKSIELYVEAMCGCLNISAYVQQKPTCFLVCRAAWKLHVIRVNEKRISHASCIRGWDGRIGADDTLQCKI